MSQRLIIKAQEKTIDEVWEEDEWDEEEKELEEDEWGSYEDELDEDEWEDDEEPMEEERDE